MVRSDETQMIPRPMTCVPRATCILFKLAVLLALAPALHALEPFPLRQIVVDVKTNLAATMVKSTGLGQSNYLNVISGIANYFQHFQDADGRIIDPFYQKEYQYSTPCYAWAATALVVSGRQTNLLESAASALECALIELAEDKAAMNHGDFFTFPCMLAYENLRDRVAPERRKKWEQLLRQLQPQRCYEDVIIDKPRDVHNWNIVALSGEFLRYQDGFTDLSFVEKYLSLQLKNFTSTGQYRDPNLPLAYDHFPRHFLAAILQRGYDGQHRAALEELLDRAAWTSLLIQSPNGELPTGGRSAQHQWNEAEQCVTFEVWANRNKRAGDNLSANAFKRAAHLSLESIQRWVRPSGELWIVKNRFDPAVRHGFQGYSSHSQYNLLAASMLSTAWMLADDSITEGACPADVGGFAFELPEFHKVFANAGGLYLEIDTGADAEYNSTGLIRVHKAGLESLIGPSDSTAIHDEPLAIGIAWAENNGWKSLASFGHGAIKSAKFEMLKATSPALKFSVRYEIGSAATRSVSETYEVTPRKISVRAEVEGKTSKVRVRFPAFAFDGRDATQIVAEKSKVSVQLNGSRQTFAVESRLLKPLSRPGNWIPCRNGYLEMVEAEVKGPVAIYTLTPERIERPTISQAK
ncbi:MAG: hypothetical protein JWM68_883 [Verrucomicrobiales bacterium]|nr:hypothetical protein [Verrucomicrobiales bacterium]